MSKTVLISKNENIKNLTLQKSRICGCDAVFFDTSEDFLNSDRQADVIIIDISEETEDTIEICRQIKVCSQPFNSVIILILGEKYEHSVLKYARFYLSVPIDESIFEATVLSAIQTKNAWDDISAGNGELKKNLYRLSVLNDTLTKLAGSLNKIDLIKIMTSGLEKSLSYSLCYSLIFNNPDDIILVINSVSAVSPKLELEIKLRAIIAYKEMFAINTAKDNIRTIINVKNKERQFDLINIFGFDTLFAPITVDDKPFGIVEVFRETEFTNEDSIHFQTMVKQAKFPLQSAVLYEEIKEQNLKLEKMEKVKSEFLSVVSHELKTPLTVIKNALKILLGGLTGLHDERSLHFLKMGYKNCEKLMDLIKDLLDFSKMEAGKLEFSFKKSPIYPIIESVKNSMSGMAEEKGINLLFNIDPELPLLCIDSGRIEQVLYNLISNAVKFTPEGGRIEVSSFVAEAKSVKPENEKKNYSRYVVVKVSDNGPGIAPEDISKVFEKFGQVESSLTRNVGGTGLGLPISKQFAQIHEGYLELESTPGKGSDFYLALPVMNDIEMFLIQFKKDLPEIIKKNSEFEVFVLNEKTGDTSKLPDFEEILDRNRVFNKTEKSVKFDFEYFNNKFIVFYDLNLGVAAMNFLMQTVTEKVAENSKIADNIEYNVLRYGKDFSSPEDFISRLEEISKGFSK